MSRRYWPVVRKSPWSLLMWQVSPDVLWVWHLQSLKAPPADSLDHCGEWAGIVAPAVVAEVERRRGRSLEVPTTAPFLRPWSLRLEWMPTLLLVCSLRSQWPASSWDSGVWRRLTPDRYARDETVWGGIWPTPVYFLVGGKPNPPATPSQSSTQS